MSAVVHFKAASSTMDEMGLRCACNRQSSHLRKHLRAYHQFSLPFGPASPFFSRRRRLRPPLSSVVLHAKDERTLA